MHILKERIKSIAFLLLGSNLRASFRIKRIFKRDSLTILNLHRVQEFDGSSYSPLEPSIFSELLTYLKRNFTLTTFGNLDEIAAEKKLNKPLLILSFDDGYKDFVDVAVPLLFEHKIKVNQNIVPECVESGLPPFNVLVQDFIGKCTEKELKSLNILGFESDEILFNRPVLGQKVSNFLKNKSHADQTVLKDAFMSYISPMEEFKASPMMTLDNIKEVGDLHELGVHSYSHASMEHESDEYFKKDLVSCQNWFLEKIGKKAEVYAFPNGSYRNHHIDLALEAGYKHILLVNEGFSSKDKVVHNRFTFYANSIKEMRFKALGGFSVL